MEVLLYNSTVCRLCGEENDNGTLLYTCEGNIQSLSEVINTYLPIKVTDDGQLPRIICPGCTIQLEATVEFLNLIIKGQKVIRELHQREKEYKKTVFNQLLEEPVVTDNIGVEVDAHTEVYQVDHPISLQVAGLNRLKYELKSPEELAQEASVQEKQQKCKEKADNDELTGKRRSKTPTSFMGGIQGKELEKIFKEEVITDDEMSDTCIKIEVDDAPKSTVLKQAEIIGNKEDSGKLVVAVEGKDDGRPKGRMRPTHEECGVCGMEFSCVSQFMSHVAQHDRVSYQCGQCDETFTTHLLFNEHQTEQSHTGQRIISINKGETIIMNIKEEHVSASQRFEVCGFSKPVNDAEPTGSLADLNFQPVESVSKSIKAVSSHENLQSSTAAGTSSSPITKENNTKREEVAGSLLVEIPNQERTATATKRKLKCNYCDKLFSSKQSKSLHTKAIHYGERPHVCVECGATFGYPRSLALHKLSHRHKRNAARGYSCDHCGKVFNHPSSVVYHKEAEHAGQIYVCNDCGKSFKHKQLLARHQLVHTQLRPFNCKICDATFKTKPRLLNHQQVHTRVKR